MNNTFQNTRIAGTEKHGQKDGQPEAGKTQQSAVSASAKLKEQSADTAAAEAYQYEAEDLSEYTDTELKQMYYNGEITRQEYEDETGETLE